MCLEFSKIDNEILSFIYKQYSKTIPLIGKLIVGSDEPYNYLIKSMKNFIIKINLLRLYQRMVFVMLNTEPF